MQVSYQGSSPLTVRFYFEGDPSISENLTRNGYFEGKEGQFFTQLGEDTCLLFCGLGKKSESVPFKLLNTGIKLFSTQLAKLKLPSAALDLGTLDEKEVFFLLEGLFLSALYVNPFQKIDPVPTLTQFILLTPHQQSAQRAWVFSQNRNLVRNLVDMPANVLTTKNFTEKIQEIFADTPVQVEIWDTERLKNENMQGLLSVGQGSSMPPYLVKLHYRPPKVEKQITLIGKGIVFDAGGYSLKPSDSMLDMKGDMAGAATVAGTLKTIYDLGLPLEVYALLPIAENLISGQAYRVSDIIRYSNGKTVEINNTDAEGRLVLADALLHANTLPPKTIIDLATLTGACMVALGPDIYGAFSNDNELAARFVQFVNDTTSETAWVLPLFHKYKEQLKSSIADLKNTGKRWGGAITAALFLNEFVDKEKTWLHLDIAGPFFDEGLGLFENMATGIPLESLALFLEKQLTW